VLIVAGEFEVDPAQRDAFLAGRLDAIRRSRAEPGCLEYTMSADPIDAGRVVLFERWSSQEALDAHLSEVRTAPRPPSGPEVEPKAVSIRIFDVAGERSIAD
jgi:quinol monooxygenase YgiN